MSGILLVSEFCEDIISFLKLIGKHSWTKWREMGIIWRSVSFWGSFGDHLRVGDHFGVGITSEASQYSLQQHMRKSSSHFPLVQLTVQTSVVQRLDSAIHRINLYPVDSAITFPNYSLGSDLSGR